MKKIKSLKQLEEWFENMGATKETEDGIVYYELTPSNLEKKEENKDGNN